MEKKLLEITNDKGETETIENNKDWLRTIYKSSVLTQTDPVHTWAKAQITDNHTFHFIIQHNTVPSGMGKLFMDAIVERSNPGINNLIIWENFYGPVSEDSESLLTEQASELANKVKNGFVLTITQNLSIPQEVIAEALSMFKKISITPIIHKELENAEIELNRILSHLETQEDINAYIVQDIYRDRL